MKIKALSNYVVVELQKSTTTTKKTKGGLYVLSQPVEDVTKSGDRVDTTSVIVRDVGPEANPELKPGMRIIVNYYELQITNEVEEGHIYGIIPSSEIKGIVEDV